MLPPFSWKLFFLFVSYITGLLVPNIFNLNSSPVIGIFVSLYLLSLFLPPRRVFLLFLCFLITALGFLRVSLENSKSAILENLLKYKELKIKGVVKTIPQQRDKDMRFLLGVREIDSQEGILSIRVMVSSPYDENLEPGDYISLLGKIRRTSRGLIFYAQSLKKYNQIFSFKRYFYRLKKSVSRRISLFYPKPYSTFLKAVILGEPSRELRELRYVFQKAGIAHILAISGLHIGLILFFFHFLLKTTGIYTRYREIILLVLLLIYTSITGAKPPVVRATLMASIYIYFWFFYIRPNPFNVLIFSAFIILIFNPDALYQESFLLSFSAISGIFTLFYILPLGKNYKMINYLKVTTGSWIFVSPLLWYYWQGISVMGLFSNIILLPIFSFLIASTFSALLSSFISSSIAQFFTLASYPFLYFIFRFSFYLAHLPYSYLRMPQISIEILILIYSVLLLIIFLIRGIIKNKLALGGD